MAATLFAAMGLQAAYLTAPIIIDTVKVGDAGNLGDTSGTKGAGAVDYEYYISTTEVTVGQYTSFLNAVATDKRAPSYILGLRASGIVRTDNGDGTYSYTAINENLPVSAISFYDAMRFCNWLSTGDTETGVYMLNGGSSMDLIVRNDEAWAAGGIAITNLDEWYKAAYYQGNGTYSRYANGTNTAPTADEANFLDSGIGTVTDADFGAASYYGTFGQNGNVREWIEGISGSNAVYFRGGGFDTAVPNSASNNSIYLPIREYVNLGFRITSLQLIPEPGICAAIFGTLALAIVVYRRRK